jgi:hypothetical protein
MRRKRKKEGHRAARPRAQKATIAMVAVLVAVLVVVLVASSDR